MANELPPADQKLTTDDRPKCPRCDCTFEMPKCLHQMMGAGCTCPAAITEREKAYSEIETKFWSIVDGDGLASLPSDMWAALDILARAARNRDMWKAQCDRQAAQFEAMRLADINAGGTL